MLHYEYKELLQFIKKMAENSIKNDSILEHKYSNENNHNQAGEKSLDSSCHQ